MLDNELYLELAAKTMEGNLVKFQDEIKKYPKSGTQNRLLAVTTLIEENQQIGWPLFLIILRQEFQYLLQLDDDRELSNFELLLKRLSNHVDDKKGNFLLQLIDDYDVIQEAEATFSRQASYQHKCKIKFLKNYSYSLLLTLNNYRIEDKSLIRIAENLSVNLLIADDKDIIEGEVQAIPEETSHKVNAIHAISDFIANNYNSAYREFLSSASEYIYHEMANKTEQAAANKMICKNRATSLVERLHGVHKQEQTARGFNSETPANTKEASKKSRIKIDAASLKILITGYNTHYSKTKETRENFNELLQLSFDYAGLSCDHAVDVFNALPAKIKQDEFYIERLKDKFHAETNENKTKILACLIQHYKDTKGSVNSFIFIRNMIVGLTNGDQQPNGLKEIVDGYNALIEKKSEGFLGKLWSKLRGYSHYKLLSHKQTLVITPKENEKVKERVEKILVTGEEGISFRQQEFNAVVDKQVTLSLNAEVNTLPKKHPFRTGYNSAQSLEDKIKFLEDNFDEYKHKLARLYKKVKPVIAHYKAEQKKLAEQNAILQDNTLAPVYIAITRSVSCTFIGVMSVISDRAKQNEGKEGIAGTVINIGGSLIPVPILREIVKGFGAGLIVKDFLQERAKNKVLAKIAYSYTRAEIIAEYVAREITLRFRDKIALLSKDGKEQFASHVFQKIFVIFIQNLANISDRDPLEITAQKVVSALMQPLPQVGATDKLLSLFGNYFTKLDTKSNEHVLTAEDILLGSSNLRSILADSAASKAKKLDTEKVSNDVNDTAMEQTPIVPLFVQTTKDVKKLQEENVEQKERLQQQEELLQKQAIQIQELFVLVKKLSFSIQEIPDINNTPKKPENCTTYSSIAIQLQAENLSETIQEEVLNKASEILNDVDATEQHDAFLEAQKVVENDLVKGMEGLMPTRNLNSPQTPKLQEYKQQLSVLQLLSPKELDVASLEASNKAGKVVDDEKLAKCKSFLMGLNLLNEYSILYHKVNQMVVDTEAATGIQTYAEIDYQYHDGEQIQSRPLNKIQIAAKIAFVIEAMWQESPLKAEEFPEFVQEVTARAPVDTPARKTLEKLAEEISKYGIYKENTKICPRTPFTQKTKLTPRQLQI